MPIPKLILQTHRDPAISEELRQTWIQQHPGYEYRFFNNAQCRQFFTREMPHLLPTFEKLPLPVQKTDLFRYAAIYVYGGIYADVDTICMAPVDSYLSMAKNQLAVGVEMTPAIFNGEIHEYTTCYNSPTQLLQWTFAASPKHPALAKLLAKIQFMVSLLTQAEIIDYSRNARFTLELTGPMCFTHVLHDFMSMPRNASVSVLPQLCWGYNPWQNIDIQLPHPAIKVQHLYHGSWKAKPSEPILPKHAS